MNALGGLWEQLSLERLRNSLSTVQQSKGGYNKKVKRRDSKQDGIKIFTINSQGLARENKLFELEEVSDKIEYDILHYTTI